MPSHSSSSVCCRHRRRRHCRCTFRRRDRTVAIYRRERPTASRLVLYVKRVIDTTRCCAATSMPAGLVGRSVEGDTLKTRLSFNWVREMFDSAPTTRWGGKERSGRPVPTSVSVSARQHFIRPFPGLTLITIPRDRSPAESAPVRFYHRYSSLCPSFSYR